MLQLVLSMSTLDSLRVDQGVRKLECDILDQGQLCFQAGQLISLFIGVKADMLQVLTFTYEVDSLPGNITCYDRVHPSRA
jgi:hypothetical protein